MSDAPGPASYFPAIEKRYGRPVQEWIDLVTAHVDAGAAPKHGALVTWLKSTHGMGHGHATAIVATVLKRR